MAPHLEKSSLLDFFSFSVSWGKVSKGHFPVLSTPCSFPKPSYRMLFLLTHCIQYSSLLHFLMFLHSCLIWAISILEWKYYITHAYFREKVSIMEAKGMASLSQCIIYYFSWISSVPLFEESIWLAVKWQRIYVFILLLRLLEVGRMWWQF